MAHARCRQRTGRGHVAGGHACPRRSTWTPMWGTTWQWGVSIWRAHGLVGPGKKFGAVTQMRYSAPIFKLESSGHFFRVGLCPHTVLLQVMWRHNGRRIHGHRVKCVDAVDTKSTRSPITTRAFKMHLSEKIKGLTLHHVASSDGRNSSQD